MGIPNKAAALIGTKLGVEKMADIYINALDKYLEPKSGFADAAQATYLIASEKYGQKSPEALAVQQAWEAVGLSPSARGVRAEPMPSDGPRINLVN
jgi:Zn-dependent metalloprotease